MRPYVDQELCIGCGLCVSTLPEVFAFNGEERAEALREPDGGEEDAAREAMENCPTDAIREA